MKKMGRTVAEVGAVAVAVAVAVVAAVAGFDKNVLKIKSKKLYLTFRNKAFTF